VEAKMKENKVLKQMVILLLLLTVVNTVFLVLSYSATKEVVTTVREVSIKTAEVSLYVPDEVTQEAEAEVRVYVVEDEEEP
jgi:phosphopantetheine adenylyltransferase